NWGQMGRGGETRRSGWEFMGLWKGRRRKRSPRLANTLFCKERGRSIPAPAMNNAMSNRRHIPPPKPLGADSHHRLSCCGMVEVFVLEAFLNEEFASRI